METILKNHTHHIINEDKTSDKLTGVMIQVNESQSVFQVRAATNCSTPDVGQSEQLTCECVGLGSTECNKINNKWICSKCNRPLAG